MICTEGSMKPTVEPRLLTVSHVKHARDNIARAADVSWSKLAGRLTRFAVRSDIVGRIERDRRAIDQAIDSGRWRDPSTWLEHRVFDLQEKLEGEQAQVMEDVRSQLYGWAKRRRKAEQPAWIPARFVGPHRRRADVLDVQLVVLDHDDGHPIEDEVERWRGHACMVHTSWSHTPEHPKFRVVLPLLKPVPAMLWPRVFQHLQARTGGRIDPQTKNADRIFFLPAIPHADAPRFAQVFEGDWLDIDAARLPKTQQELAKERAQERQRERHRRTVFGSNDDLDREARRALREDPAVRRRAAERLGGELHQRASGEVAKNMACPACSRRSVWFYVDATQKAGAECEHRNSCGWSGSLEEL